MKRKLFLRSTLSLPLLSTLINGISLKSFGEGSFFQKALNQSKYPGRVLVLIQLDGGNDGLNTVIPIDQYENLSKARKNLLIPERKILRLHQSSVTGFHPAMKELQRLYNNNQLSVIQGVGYPNPDLSHFRSIDIWNTGSDSGTELHTGWLGRFLDLELNNSAESALTGPPAIQLGSINSNVLQGPAENMGMVVTNTQNFYDLDTGQQDTISDSEFGLYQLSFMRNKAVQSKDYWLKVKSAANAQRNLSSKYPEPGSNSLADQLKIAAQLIGGGLETQIYVVNLTGFDTHDAQVQPDDSTSGLHAELLSKLSVAIAAFEDDLQLMGKSDHVLGMTYSEFGRRIKSNSSFGCDHGTSAPMLLFGSKLKGGLIGKNPEIADHVEVNDNLPMQFDFRSVYASVLRGWFGLDDKGTNETLLDKFPVLELFNV